MPADPHPSLPDFGQSPLADANGERVAADELTRWDVAGPPRRQTPLALSAIDPPPVLAWEPLPDDFPLPSGPADSASHLPLAAALNDSLDAADLLPASALAAASLAFCASLGGQLLVKAPDWAYVPALRVPRVAIDRSYTPQLHGDFPAIVMEFLAETDGGEYSSKPTFPPGKWFFYEQVLQVPFYAIFEPRSGNLEVYRLETSGRYKVLSDAVDGRYWIPPLNLALGVWRGRWQGREGAWLRWWDAGDRLLPWNSERAEAALQSASAAASRAAAAERALDRERQLADRDRARVHRERKATVDRLRALGLSDNQIAAALGTGDMDTETGEGDTDSTGNGVAIDGGG